MEVEGAIAGKGDVQKLDAEQLAKGLQSQCTPPELLVVLCQHKTNMRSEISKKALTSAPT